MTNAQRYHVLIREAVASDATAIVKVHYDAVHLTASKDYDAEILDDWSILSDERIENLETQISKNPERSYMIVAEIDAHVVGFGEIVPVMRELRAIYVSPFAARKGVGKALLLTLEAAARERGVPELCLDSSLTAELFYLAHGYEIRGRSEHQLRSGRKMACIKMRKSLL